MRIFLLLLIAALIGIALSQCPLSSGTPQQLKTCLDQVAYKATEAQIIVDNVIKIFEGSTLTPGYNSNTPPFFPKVDVLAELNKIKTESFGSYFDFFTRMVALVQSLNDGHVEFPLPSGYDDYLLIRPYTVIFKWDATKKFLRGYLEDCYEPCEECQEATNTALTKVCDSLASKKGKEIVRINKRSAWKFFVKYARTIGTYSDIGGRFNQAIQDPSSVLLWQHYRYKYPDADTLRFADNTTVVVPLIADNRNGATQTKILQSIEKLITDSTKGVNDFYGTGTATTRLTKLKENIDLRKGPSYDFTKDKTRATTNGCQLNKEIDYAEGKDKASIFVCNQVRLGEKVVVLAFPTFSDSDVSALNIVRETIKIMNDNSATKLMVDVSNNGGGFIGLGYVLAMALTNQPPTNFLDFYTYRKTAGFNSFATSSGNDDSNCFTPDGTKLTWTQLANLGSVSYPEYDKQGTFSQSFHFFTSPTMKTSAEFYAYVYENQNIPAVPVSPVKELLVLADGRCLSTCSIFTTAIEGRRNAGGNYRTVQYGGFPNRVFDTSSVACNVFGAFSGLQYTTRALLVNTSADGTGGKIRQFSRSTSNFRLNIWGTSSNRLEIYSEAIEKFGFSG